MQDTIDEIREQWRRRQAWHRAEKSLTLQAKAMCRRLCNGDKGEAEKLFKDANGPMNDPLAPIARAAFGPIIAAQKPLIDSRKLVEKRLVKLAKELPAYEFVESVNGFGAMGFAGIVGEAGDIGAYRNASCFRKRMGLAVIDGGRQRRVAGIDALDHGYSPARRSVVWTIGDSLFKAQSGKVCKDTGEVLKEPGRYRMIYDRRKEYLEERDPDSTKGHRHNSAKRYMEGKLMRDLYVAWRACHGLSDVPKWWQDAPQAIAAE